MTLPIDAMSEIMPIKPESSSGIPLYDDQLNILNTSSTPSHAGFVMPERNRLPRIANTVSLGTLLSMAATILTIMSMVGAMIYGAGD